MIAGAIDCDIHPAVPKLAALIPYLEPHWAESVVERGINELDTIAYPLNAPLTARPDWRQEGVKPGADLAALQRDALDAFGTRIAICNCLYGVPVLFSEDMAAGFARAVNDWMAREWLDRDTRLRASIVVPLQSPERAAAEIERCAADPRFVQVLLPGLADAPLGHRAYWPIYAAAERHRPAGRHPCRQHVPPSGHADGVALLLHRGLHRPGAGAAVAAHQPGLRGRVLALSGADRGADRIRGSPGCPLSCGG